MSRKGNIIYHISVAAISILMEIAALGMLKYTVLWPVSADRQNP